VNARPVKLGTHRLTVLAAIAVWTLVIEETILAACE